MKRIVGALVVGAVLLLIAAQAGAEGHMDVAPLLPGDEVICQIEVCPTPTPRPTPYSIVPPPMSPRPAPTPIPGPTDPLNQPVPNPTSTPASDPTPIPELTSDPTDPPTPTPEPPTSTPTASTPGPNSDSDSGVLGQDGIRDCQPNEEECLLAFTGWSNKWALITGLGVAGLGLAFIRAGESIRRRRDM